MKKLTKKEMDRKIYKSTRENTDKIIIQKDKFLDFVYMELYNKDGTMIDVYGSSMPFKEVLMVIESILIEEDENEK